jgi:fructokinase
VKVGGIEAGGTRWTCAVSSEGTTLERIVTFPTTTPSETFARAIDFFGASEELGALGIGCFGPIVVDRESPDWGEITTTPKPGWAGTDVVAKFVDALGVPIGFDTDVNAAALAESRWGAAVGLDTSCYVTVGTGIGGGAVVNGRLLHGLLHPELGHMRIPHDRSRDPFEGSCPFHGDCLEGLASGEALRQRWGRPAEELTAAEIWDLEAEYLGLGLLNLVFALSPQRIVLGGGVASAQGLLTKVRDHLQKLIGGYMDLFFLGAGIDDYLVAPELGSRAGVLGAIQLGRDAASTPAG